MKRSRLSYDSWNFIISKDMYENKVDTEMLKGTLWLNDVHEVSEKKYWNFNGEDILICDKGIKWLFILPKNDWYCITAMLNEEEDIVLWYIDMIAGQGVDPDGVPYIDDLYLDLIVYPDGTIMVDDMNELEEALAKGNITKGQFNLAIKTSNKLKEGLLSDVDGFKDYTKRCYEMLYNKNRDLYLFR